MKTLTRSVTPMAAAGQTPLPISIKKYLREIALAMQAPQLAALATRGAL